MEKMVRWIVLTSPVHHVGRHNTPLQPIFKNTKPLQHLISFQVSFNVKQIACRTEFYALYLSKADLSRRLYSSVCCSNSWFQQLYSLYVPLFYQRAEFQKKPRYLGQYYKNQYRSINTERRNVLLDLIKIT